MTIKPSVLVEKIEVFKNGDLSDLCDATNDTLNDNALSFTIGLSRSEPLIRERLEAYWNGVMMVPERVLIVGRVDGVIASSIQLVRPSPSNQTSAFAGSVDHHFVAPWARGHGLAKLLLTAAEEEARMQGLHVLKLNVRANLEAAIRLYESMGYVRWGTLPKYEMAEGKILEGYFYYRDL